MRKTVSRIAAAVVLSASALVGAVALQAQATDTAPPAPWNPPVFELPDERLPTWWPPGSTTTFWVAR